MKIVNSFPPNIQSIKSKFKIDGKPVVFTYGSTIFNPKGATIPDHIVHHEEVHERQQNKIDGGPEFWWKKYLDDPQFRLAQELDAYREQYRFVRQKYGRQQARQILRIIAKDLSCEIYGNIISYTDALALIKNI